MSYESRASATFLVDGTESVFNYAITVTNERLRVWVEDAVTRQQWQSSELAMDEYIRTDNAIPRFTPVHYAARFVECLNPTVETDDPARSYELSRPAEDGSRVFAVSFSLQFMTMTTVLRYRFTLAQVELDAVELLTARVGQVETTLASVDVVCKDIRDEMRLQFATLMGLLQRSSVLASGADAFHCPIGLDVMRDPVITPSGVTYERAMIVSHLQSVGAFDPTTNEPLTVEQLYPNRALRELIQKVQPDDVA